MSHSRAIEVPHVPASGYALSIPPVAAPVTLTLEGQVQNALNLVMPLKSPAQMPALLQLLAERRPGHPVRAAVLALRALRPVPAESRLHAADDDHDL